MTPSRALTEPDFSESVTPVFFYMGLRLFHNLFQESSLANILRKLISPESRFNGLNCRSVYAYLHCARRGMSAAKVKRSRENPEKDALRGAGSFRAVEFGTHQMGI